VNRIFRILNFIYLSLSPCVSPRAINTVTSISYNRNRNSSGVTAYVLMDSAGIVVYLYS
jgi:hypothetical protein